ncbi:hypothetical protein LLT7_03430 [Lactococcus cremoris subsp. cremoris TIFN7]|nr:hypothetical protein LLT7_03430 [Lactococcus cremoris subsp. cremoris TIFN7]
MVPFNKVIRFGFKKIENIGVPFFNFILGFILSVLFLTVGMLLLDSIEKMVLLRSLKIKRALSELQIS